MPLLPNMRLLIIILLLATSVTLFGQDVDKRTGKVHVYLTEKGDRYSQRKVDSIWHFMNHFVSARKLKETSDSIYFSLIHFDKKFVSQRYQQDGNYCDNRLRKSEKEIREKFPFNSLHSIKVVSFKRLEDDSVEVELEIPKTNGKIDFSKLYEVKTLNKDLTSKMLDILVNYDNKGGGMRVFFCYEPRNAIIFLGESDTILGYIEICFACQQYKIYPSTMSMGNFCTEKMDAIQGIMISAGLTYGMKARGQE